MMGTNDMLKNIADQTNIYSLQRDGTSIATSKKEIEVLFGIFFRIGIVQMPRARSYWELETRYNLVADAMSRNRFEKLVSTIHFKNNLDVTEEEKLDKIWKLRPWLSKFRENCLKIPPEEHNSIDEIMVSFKGKSSIKQYIRGKPNPWGFKLWGRAGISGILYDFDVYQGASKNKPTELGVGGDIVMKLKESLDEGKTIKFLQITTLLQLN